MSDSGEQLSIVVEHEEKRTLVRLRGELDLVTAPDLTAALQRANSEIIVDLADLEFMDASGLGVFAQAGVRAQQLGHEIFVVNAGALTQRMFELTGLEEMLSGTDAP